ncbi:hypothetical protein IscW_ISCW010141 [Ixodes scapularis]|uniref:Uncharacterized protein n=1 Tax=Ixodes scapularis TaxID=6945 RepID=B7Q0K2_IXOSC|nr:hypothetical protein IscW_ISCW010141 [Ixodes scapularis]|eukprot:XP_002407960.1 hypothetical protein IscW_ISCW010141 [Ixodes scapularis]
MACAQGWWHTGHWGSPLPHTLLAHSMQNMLWPQGTSAATTSLSKHTTQSRLPRLPGAGGPPPVEPRESVGELATLSGPASRRSGPPRTGGGAAKASPLVPRAKSGQATAAGSKVGESPRPSSDS